MKAYIITGVVVVAAVLIALYVNSKTFKIGSSYQEGIEGYNR